ncbi:MAG TPA: DUF3376 domain-containing protein [Chthoniobacterales bacterium]|nr:DUF3376 domain-containing protein [Chthoniobacterales bacterium]
MCLKHYYDNFLIYDLITYPIQYGTGAGEANVVEVYRVSPEDSPSLMQETAGQPRDKLAGRTLMSFGAFLDENWRKNDMLWGRLDGAERLINILLENHPDERAAFLARIHSAILREETLQGNGDAVCRLLSNALAHSDGSANEHLGQVLQDILKPELASYLTEMRRDYLITPEKFDRDLDPETALKYISRATNITGNMLEGLADERRSNGGKRMASWVTRFGTAFWNMIAVAVPQSLGNLFFRHWLGLLYLFSVVVIVAEILFKSSTALGWQMLASAISLQVLTLLLGDFMAGKKRWMHAARRLGILLLAALLGFGVYFVSDRTLSWFTVENRAPALGIVTAFLVLIGLGFIEWRAWLRNFCSDPNTNFSYRLLLGLTLTTFGLVIALMVIGPVEMAGLEFARFSDVATTFKDQIGVDNLRIQLGVDFALIVAYAAMLASYCVAGAKLLWQHRDNIDYKFQQDRQAALARAESDKKAGRKPAAVPQKPALPARLLRSFLLGAVIAGFALAGLQWIAAIADASENVGLLLFLKNKPPPDFNALELAYWSATIKFSLIGLGAFYSAIAFLSGAWNKSRQPSARATASQIVQRIIFAAAASGFIYVSVHALFVCRPKADNCAPQPFSEFWARHFH